jgi:hypothetical protein
LGKPRFFTSGFYNTANVFDVLSGVEHFETVQGCKNTRVTI